MKHWFRRYAIYALARIVIFMAQLLPFAAARYLGKLIGRLAYLFLPREREKAVANLGYAFGSALSCSDKKRIAKAVFENLGQSLAEFIFLPTLKKRGIDNFVSLKGKENIERAFAVGKGVIAISAHIGNWELLAAYFALKGYPISVVAKRIRFHKFDALLNGLRRSTGIDVIERDGALRKIISVLRKNQSVAILADQDVDSLDGVFVDFFGHPAYTPSGPAAIAQSTGSVLLPVYILREGNRHTIMVEEPLETVNTGQKDKDLLENTQCWMNVTERYIRRYPEQWVWMHRRWKTKSGYRV